MPKEIKSALRYPGGKSRVVNKIIPHIPNSYKEFREPFVGGGSVFIAAKQRLNPDATYKINDLNFDLYCFWKHLKENAEKLITEVNRIKKTYKDGRKLYNELTDSTKKWSEFERAVRFFVLNRITFSGTVDSGGYSEQAFKKRFTMSSIKRLKALSKLVKNVIVEHGDYKKQVLEAGNNVFIFLDPPYFSTTDSRLYGKNGDLHTSFNHNEFAKIMKKCPHKWLITYDDSQEIRKLFNFANIYEWSVQYGMNNYKQSSAKKGEELFIANYELTILKQKKLVTFQEI
jgi:DNA adenine methylase